MLAELIDKIIAVSRVEYFEQDGRKFSSRQMFPIDRKTQKALDVTTLQAVLDYVRHSPDDVSVDDMVLHIESPRKIRLLSKAHAVERNRDELLTCYCEINSFKFNTWYEAERFNIELLSTFVPDESTDLDKILLFSSNITAVAEQNLSDDGVTQSAQVKVGLYGKTENAALPSRVVLKPYRTFIEVEQPLSEFIFRAKKTENGISFALFEADGNLWEIQAKANIRQYLGDNLADVFIIS